MTEKDLDAATVAHNKAKLALEALTGMMNQEARAAHDAVIERHRPTVSAARATLATARERLNTVRIERAKLNPLFGRKVKHNNNPQKNGTIEVWKVGDPIAGTRTPEPGTLVIRIAKKDGSPGKHIVELWTGRLPTHWQLVDEPAPEARP